MNKLVEVGNMYCAFHTLTGNLFLYENEKCRDFALSKDQNLTKVKLKIWGFQKSNNKEILLDNTEKIDEYKEDRDIKLKVGRRKIE